MSFQFNDEQAYIVEVGHLYFRFYRASGQITVPDTDAVVANGTFDTDLTGWTERNDGTGSATAWDDGAMLLTGPTSGSGGGRRYQEIAIGAAFREVTHVLTFRVTAGTVGVRIGTSAGGEQIRAVTEHKTGWHTVEFNPASAVSVFVEFAEEILNETSRVDDVVLLDNQPVELTTPYAEAEVFEFQTDQSADIMWITHRNHKPMELRRTGNSSWSIVEYTPENDPFVSAATFPRAVALWKSRLWFGGTNADPQKIWGSKVDDFQSLQTGTQLDNEAIERVIASGRINVIQWMLAGGEQMFVGTFGSEMVVTGDTDGLVTPKNVQIDPATNHGSGLIRGIQTPDSVLFLQRSRRRLRRIAFNFNEDKFQADDLFLEYNHLTSQFALTQLSPADDPDPVVWGVREDGQMLAMIINVPQKILGIARHTTKGLFRSVATIPHPSGTRDQTWVIVERTIQAGQVKMVEFFEETDGFYGQLHTDSSLTGDFTGNPVDSVGGLAHLEGETVQIVGDGAAYPEQVVVGGAVALDPPAEFVEVGLGYAAILETLRPSLGPQQSIDGLTVAIGDLTLHVQSLVTVEVNGETLPDRSSEMRMDFPPPLFTGDLPVPTVGWGPDEGRVLIRQPHPLPTTILALSETLAVGDA